MLKWLRKKKNRMLIATPGMVLLIGSFITGLTQQPHVHPLTCLMYLIAAVWVGFAVGLMKMADNAETP
jgi:peptidoglycan/LPS O-acetylase OafA/YrhL